MLALNYVDIIIVVILALSTLLGLSRGFAKEFFSLLTLVAAVAVCIFFTKSFADFLMQQTWLQQLISHDDSTTSLPQSAEYLLLAMSGFLLFIATMIVGFIVTHFISVIFQWGGFGIFNRFLGALFGLVRGLLWVTIMVFLVQLTALRDEAVWKQANLVPYYLPFSNYIEKETSPTLDKLKQHMSKDSKEDKSKNKQDEPNKE